MRFSDLRRDTRGFGAAGFAMTACALALSAVFITHQLDQMNREGTLRSSLLATLLGTSPRALPPRFDNIDRTPTASISKIKIDPCTGAQK